ncbi:HFL028Cp [Eremothecium sinecaudum]|uniref:HFL028Cp n=1 Tax=Eremothecium sinecaudum TaxID=45286 RepID=A0A109V0F6_9SACH|nr:HFL028Cp [Eremothecium sinecaudum]AMD21828.1 HFL028Cp [Eremothecium sinecaudum]
MEEGHTHFRQLPAEIVYEILSRQFRDLMSNDHPPSSEKYHSNLKIFLKSNSTVNKIFYRVSRVLVYRYLNFATARCFNRVLEVLKKDTTGLRRLVQVADFQELSSIGLGRTGEMNKMIKNLTRDTLYEFLLLTSSNLREFLASEHIQGDLDERVIFFLVRPGSLLNVLDFCGCSGAEFTETFINVVSKLYDKESGEPKQHNYQLTSIGLHDCTDLPTETLGLFLSTVPELQKLDLSHTSIDDYTLVNVLPHWKNLSHLSLGNCSQLTPRGILEFFSYHPTVTDNNNCTLQWLSLKTHKHTSSWTETQTMFLLKKLCRYGHNLTLQYLNIGGMPLHYSEDNKIVKTAYYYQCQDTLTFIKWNFPKLKSLSIRKANIPIQGLVRFLSVEDTLDRGVIEYSSSPSTTSCTRDSILQQPIQQQQQQLRFLDVAGNSYLNKWTVTDSALFTSSDSLVAVELPFESWQEIERRKGSEITFMKPLVNGITKSSMVHDYSRVEEVKWKCYMDASYGRRYWIYKVDDILNQDDLDHRGSMTRYDEQGRKIVEIISQPDFLKYAQNKIMLGCGIVPLTGIRREKTYREMRHPLSRYISKDGKLSITGTYTAPIRRPRLPPGIWRIIHNGEDEDLNSEPIEEDMPENITRNNNEQESRSNSFVYRQATTRDGLYWDRSVTDLQLLAAASGTDNTHDIISINSSNIPAGINEFDLNYEDLDNPELQRRRSQFNLFRLSSATIPNEDTIVAGSERASLLAKALINWCPLQQTLPYYNQLSQQRSLNGEYPEWFSPQISKTYTVYLQTMDEYEVFGCIERGIYRYYSLKT